jgi:hypothetical protein
VVVKIEANKPADCLKNSKLIKEATKRVAWTNDSLPDGYTSHKCWNNVFIPHVRDFMDSLENPWELEKVDMVAKIQYIADKIYPDIPHTVSTKEAVFNRVCHLHYPSSLFTHSIGSLSQTMQKMSEHRGRYGSTALRIVTERLCNKDLFPTLANRKAHVEYCLGSGYPFLFKAFNAKLKVYLQVTILRDTDVQFGIYRRGTAYSNLSCPYLLNTMLQRPQYLGMS